MLQERFKRFWFWTFLIGSLVMSHSNKDILARKKQQEEDKKQLTIRRVFAWNHVQNKFSSTSAAIIKSFWSFSKNLSRKPWNSTESWQMARRPAFCSIKNIVIHKLKTFLTGPFFYCSTMKMNLDKFDNSTTWRFPGLISFFSWEQEESTHSFSGFWNLIQICLIKNWVQTLFKLYHVGILGLWAFYDPNWYSIYCNLMMLLREFHNPRQKGGDFSSSGRIWKFLIICC